MLTTWTNYDVKCMLCSTEVGQIVNSKFTQHAGCANKMPRKLGMLRCCHCGGSLYLDPTDVYQTGLDRAQLMKAAVEDAA